MILALKVLYGVEPKLTDSFTSTIKQIIIIQSINVIIKICNMKLITTWIHLTKNYEYQAPLRKWLK